MKKADFEKACDFQAGFSSVWWGLFHRDQACALGELDELVGVTAYVLAKKIRPDDYDVFRSELSAAFEAFLLPNPDEFERHPDHDLIMKQVKEGIGFGYSDWLDEQLYGNREEEQ